MEITKKKKYNCETCGIFMKINFNRKTDFLIFTLFLLIISPISDLFSHTIFFRNGLVLYGKVSRQDNIHVFYKEGKVEKKIPKKDLFVILQQDVEDMEVISKISKKAASEKVREESDSDLEVIYQKFNLEEIPKEQSIAPMEAKETKTKKYYEKKFSLNFMLSGGSGYGLYDQPKSDLLIQYAISGDLPSSLPFTFRNRFNGNYGDGLKLGLDYRHNQKFSFSFNYSSIGIYFRSAGVDNTTKPLYESILANQGVPEARYLNYLAGKYTLMTSTVNLGTDYYFYSKDEFEFYLGGEVGAGAYVTMPAALNQYTEFDSGSIIKLNIRTGMQYIFSNRHHFKIEPFYSNFFGERFHANFIGANFGYSYTFGVSE